MFETRIFDLYGLDFQHIRRINTHLAEAYWGQNGDDILLILFASTKREIKDIQYLLSNGIIDGEIKLNEKYYVEGCERQYIVLKTLGSCDEVEDVVIRKIPLLPEITIKREIQPLPNLISEASYLDFAYNRVDLFSEKYEVVRIISKYDEVIVPYCIRGTEVYLGISGAPLDTYFLSELKRWLKKEYPFLVSYEAMFCLAYDNKLQARNNFIIELPNTYEELLLRVKSKTRGNVRRELGYFEDKVGNVLFTHIPYAEISDELVNTYFRMKYATHGREYNMGCKEYIDYYHVTDAYVLENSHMIFAILFACEQGRIAYLENFSYLKEYERFSLGTIIYWKWLERLIENGKTSCYLAGGNFIYKKHFNSRNELCFCEKAVL